MCVCVRVCVFVCVCLCVCHHSQQASTRWQLIESEWGLCMCVFVARGETAESRAAPSVSVGGVR